MAFGMNRGTSPAPRQELVPGPLSLASGRNVRAYGARRGRRPPPQWAGTAVNIAEAGFTALELTVTLGVIGILSVLFWAWQQNSSGSSKDAIAAQQLAMVASALQQWATANEATAEANALAGGGAYVVPIATLQAAPGYLPASFQNQTPYGGVWAPMVRRVAAGQIETFTVQNGGDTLTDAHCRQAAASSNSATLGCILSSSSTQATGSYNGWSIVLANYSTAGTAGVSMATGHMAATGFFAGGTVISNFLSSTYVPGHPEANTWKTNMSGGGYNISSVGALAAHSSVMATATAGAACATPGTLGQTSTMAPLLCNTSSVWQSIPAGTVASDTLLPATQQTQGAACSLPGAVGQNATNGSPLYCDSGTATWKQPPAVANFVVWY